VPSGESPTTRGISNPERLTEKIDFVSHLLVGATSGTFARWPSRICDDDNTKGFFTNFQVPAHQFGLGHLGKRALGHHDTSSHARKPSRSDRINVRKHGNMETCPDLSIPLPIPKHCEITKFYPLTHLEILISLEHKLFDLLVFSPCSAKLHIGIRVRVRLILTKSLELHI
jgi:hypothetical protein